MNKFDTKIPQNKIEHVSLGRNYRIARMEVDCNSSKLSFGQDIQKEELTFLWNFESFNW